MALINTALTLQDLPAPPESKTGWPWTEQTEVLPNKMPDGSDWPRISIVTPNYNYGHFIEETIRSILLQGYPNLEYIIIDGASTDNSIEIIKKYEKWISYWVSEKDTGQSNAINKGLERCTGKFFNWINSDDFLELGGLQNISTEFKNFDVLAGKVNDFSEINEQEQIHIHHNLSAINLLKNKYCYHQPGIWLRTEKIKKTGVLREDLYLSFDWELTIRYLTHFPKVTYSKSVLVNFRVHSKSKTNIDYSEILKERTISLVNILHNDAYKKLYKHIEVYLKTQLWYFKVKKILDSTELSKPKKIFKIIQYSWMEPNIRISRFTLGAIRRLLISNI